MKCLAMTLLLVWIVPGPARCEDRVLDQIRAHPSWLVCENDQQCISVQLSGRDKTTGKPVCDRPVINQAYSASLNAVASTMLEGNLMCGVQWRGAVTNKCVQHRCGREICPSVETCHFYPTVP